MNSNRFGFEELELWKKVRVFKLEVRKLVKTFPLEEKYKLTDQIIRSSRSINALISEGHGRFTYPDQIHYCIQARGSLTETINHLIDAFDEDTITELRNRARAALLTEAIAKEEKVEEAAEDLLTMEGMDDATAHLLASKGIATMDDLAELAVDELVELTNMDAERAKTLIMTARAPWFK